MPEQSIDLHTLETRLDDFDPAVRAEAVAVLGEHLERGDAHLPPERDWLNLHCHSFYSFNGYGFSPSRLVWEARKLGLSMVGLVDFDVLDGVAEFHAAGRRLGLRTVAGMETRAYLEPYAAQELNSPGEPGITYHMGVGYVSDRVPAAEEGFLADLRERARARNLRILEIVNAAAPELALDYEGDVLPLTPAGVATERHLCQAYVDRGLGLGPDRARAIFGELLGVDVSDQLGDAVKLQGTFRAKTMKRGGLAYQQPDSESFPHVPELNRHIAACGAIPTMTWLDGTSAGEAAIGELMDLHMELGARALNIIPDRNWNIADPEVKERKVGKLHEVVREAEARELPIVIGTELNAPGLKLVDDFDAPELAPVVDAFRKGAEVVYGHSVALATTGAGYVHPDTEREFPERSERNAHFAALAAEHPTLAEVTTAASE